MKEFVLVEFLAKNEDQQVLLDKLFKLGDDFQVIKIVNEEERDSEILGDLEYIRISGRISSMYASIIKLQDPFLCDRMRISYISDELKDKYRT